MVKKGRFYINLDVHWYDEWGCEVSANAALLWILALGKAKQMNTVTLTYAQARAAVPKFTTEEFDAALKELVECEGAPIGGDSLPDRGAIGAIALFGFEDWNSTPLASKNGVFGNHIRWHVNTKTPDPTCEHCSKRDQMESSIGGDSLPDRFTESDIESKTLCPNDPNDLQMEFDQCWAIYPRKESKGASRECFTARRRQGIEFQSLLSATQHFTERMRSENRDKNMIMLGSTFFGSHNRWEDFLEAPPLKDEDIPSIGAKDLSDDELAALYTGEKIVLPGEDI